MMAATASRPRAASLLHRAIGAVLLVSLGAWAQTAEAPGGRQRIALVIGNDAYRSAPLNNSLNDARDMTQALQQAGFAVVLLENASQRAMAEAISAFGERIRNGEVGLFYFAGHGVQIKGRNFLLPVDQQIEREDEVSYRAIDVGQVLDKMESAQNGTNLLILDACRNNPFMRAGRSLAGGLAPMDASVGTIIAFATSPGAVAIDGVRGRNGVYTHHLLAQMRSPGVKIEEVFKRVRAAVYQETKGQQLPWESTSLVGDFVFIPPVPGSSAQPSAPKRIERELPDIQRSPLNQAGKAFSFSRSEREAAQQSRLRADQSSKLAAMPCLPARKRAPIRIELVEQLDRELAGRMGQAVGVAPRAIEARLKQAGLMVTTRDRAPYSLKGIITSQARMNRMTGVNEITITAALSLVGHNGERVANPLVRDETFTGPDLVSAYHELVREQADEVTLRIHHAYCAR
jgi:hypothetical protein